MGRHFFSQKYKSITKYILIIAVFALMVLGVYMFFKFRIKVMEKEGKSGYQITNNAESIKPEPHQTEAKKDNSK